MSEHQELHVAQICVRQEKDYPNSPVDINRAREHQGWWDITLNVRVLDGNVVEVTVEEIKKSP